MHETGLGWFMGWEHIWYVGTGWRKRLVVMQLGGHAGLWCSALSREHCWGQDVEQVGWFLCPMGWPGYKNLSNRAKAWGGSTGRAVVSLHNAWRSSSTSPGALVWNRGRCAVLAGWGDTESTAITPHCQGTTACIFSPGNLCLSISPLGAYALSLSFGRNVSASLTTGLNFTRIKSLWKLKLACWWATQKHFLSPALPSLSFALSETQSFHGGIQTLW